MKHFAKRSRLPKVTRLGYVVYQAVFHLALPLAFLLALVRARKEPAHLKHLSHRFGFGPTGPKNAIWIYAASLGEMNAAKPLVERFLEAGYPVLLAHLSPAGLAAGERLFGGNPNVTHRYMPLDSFVFVRWFLRRSKPLCGIVLEIEIWPAMLLEADRAKVPMYLANGNLLPDAMARLQTWKRHGLFLYRMFDHIFTRGDDYAQRYYELGVQRGDISITGDLRFDSPRDWHKIDAGRNMRLSWEAEFVFMIASSVKDEEDALLHMCKVLLARMPSMRILWVPRSPQRFGGVADKVALAGFRGLRRSLIGGEVPPNTQIIIGDSTGEMDFYLGFADMVFVGASLVDHGGHNIIEPLTAGVPVVMGPSTFGIDFVASPAQDAGVFQKFDTPDEIAAHVANYAASTESRARMQALLKGFATSSGSPSKACFKGIVGTSSEKTDHE